MSCPEVYRKSEQWKSNARKSKPRNQTPILVVNAASGSRRRSSWKKIYIFIIARPTRRNRSNNEIWKRLFFCVTRSNFNDLFEGVLAIQPRGTGRTARMKTMQRLTRFSQRRNDRKRKRNRMKRAQKDNRTVWWWWRTMKIAWKWRRTIATEKTRRKPKKRTRSRYGAARRQLERISGGNERHLRNNSGGRYMHHGDHDDGAHKRGRETERDREKDTEREREREKEKKRSGAAGLGGGRFVRNRYPNRRVRRVAAPSLWDRRRNWTSPTGSWP